MSMWDFFHGHPYMGIFIIGCAMFTIIISTAIIADALKHDSVKKIDSKENE